MLHYTQKVRLIRFLVEFGEGRHFFRVLYHGFQCCIMLLGIGGLVQLVLLTVKFAFPRLKLEDLLELGDFGGGRSDGIGYAANWCGCGEGRS